MTGSVRVEFNADYPAGAWNTLASGQTGSSYFWTIGEAPTEHARIRIADETYPAFADTSEDFSIVEPGVIVTAPNGGDTMIVGQTSVIRWLRAGISGAVKVELNRNYPVGTWELLSGGTTVDSFNWVVAGADAAACPSSRFACGNTDADG